MDNFFTLKPMIAAYEKKGYDYFTNGFLNLNLYGIRSSDMQAGRYDDVVGVFYKEKITENQFVWKHHQFSGTTDPGKPWLANPMRESGCAVLAPQQCRGMFTNGLHRGAYPAFVQNNPCLLYRDNNKNDTIEYFPETLKREKTGINLHRASRLKDVITVGKYSAGCQGIRKIEDWNFLWEIYQRSIKLWGPVITYTLFEECDFYD